jgi:hypothetical protein
MRCPVADDLLAAYVEDLGVEIMDASLRAALSAAPA